ncbi:MAG TPA: lamin tail domain-containing protein [Xanthomonadales bacterium]|nr:lamin tail domain-containing protein [Xanthomonadales bacterium]
MTSHCSAASRVSLAVLLAASPGLRADFANGFEDPLLVINEIEGDASTGGEDWLEFHNPGTTGSDISLWYFTDSDPTHVFMFPVGTIVPAGGYLVLEANAPASFTFGLGATDEVRLYDAQDVLVDRYGWTMHAAGTYARCPNGSGAFVDVPTTTRGSANACPP